MQFDPFDKKVKDAADRHHPAYDEKAWTQMEELLNKHLPQKEDNRRRFIFFMLLFLLAGIGTWLFISKPWQNDKKIANTHSVPIKNADSEGSSEDDAADKLSRGGTTESNIPGSDKHIDPPIVIEEQVSAQPVNETQAKNDLPQNSILNKRQTDQSSFSIIAGNTRSSNKNKIDQPVTKTSSVVQDPVVVVNEVLSERTTTVINTTLAATSSPVTASTEKPVQKEDPVIVKADVAEKQPTDTKKQKNKTSKKNSLFFSLSAGPDLSFVGSGNSSQVKLLAGAGIGFTYREKFTLRTGFYTGRKVYSAKPSDYKAPAEFYTFYPYLEKVDADCRVYEIPLSLSYNFGKKSNWFVSAGLSSFLMKEESYNYFYKYTPTGNTYTNRWTIKDKNSHYFSVATLSAGYKHTIGKRVTVMAEPYMKIPFAGVGYGKVKLNSGGVLFTVGIRAF